MEQWKPIKDFENLYEVSNQGNVRSAFREGTKGGLLKVFSDKRYYKVHLYKNGKQYQPYVHRLVAAAFLDKVDGKTEINHKNGNKLDNRVDNLEWCSRSENIQHAYKLGLRKTKKVVQLKEGKIIKKFNNMRQASLETNICYVGIYWCVNGIRNSAGGFEWRFDK